MVRNTEDVLYSLYPFFENHGQAFRDAWGGFPPVFKGSSGFEEHVDFCLEENVPMGSFIRNWWELRKEPNVLLLHYADVYKDTPGALRRIATYLDLQVPEQAIIKCAKRVSIEFMEPRNNRYLLRFGKNMDSLVLKPKGGSLIREGGSGGYKAYM
mmetsp:Transcript_14092/g.23024  ORF Transcript_14092/g.23024 Transcript_14092/m.23024 type:complete len:155 (-) Transcript_14092:1375-1839(-)